MSAPFENFEVLRTVRSANDKSFGYIVSVRAFDDYEAGARFIEKAISDAIKLWNVREGKSSLRQPQGGGSAS